MGFLDKAGEWSREREEILGTLLAGEPRPGPSLARALRGARRGGLGVIVEYKRCSPSGGLISLMDPQEYIGETLPYATAYSVLTEPRWFCGSLEFIPLFARHRPVLAKDFVVSTVQLEAYARVGASAVLLIASLVGYRLPGLCSSARRLGLEPLVEAHSLEEALRAYEACPDAILGVNSRDLSSLRVDFESMLSVVKRLRGELGEDALIVAESGVDSPERAVRAYEAGADAILIGSAVMRDPGLLWRIWAAFGLPR